MHDVLAWSFYTDLHDTQKGPATELVLGGTAKDFIRALPLDHKRTDVCVTRATEAARHNTQD